MNLNQLTSIDYNALDEVSIFEDALTQQQIVRANWDSLSRGMDHSAVKAVNLCSRSINFHVTSKTTGFKISLLKLKITFIRAQGQYFLVQILCYI